MKLNIFILGGDQEAVRHPQFFFVLNIVSWGVSVRT